MLVFKELFTFLKRIVPFCLTGKYQTRLEALLLACRTSVTRKLFKTFTPQAYAIIKLCWKGVKVIYYGHKGVITLGPGPCQSLPP